LPTLELTRTVTVSLDHLAGIDELERAALEFARTAPAAIIASTTEEMVEGKYSVIPSPPVNADRKREHLITRTR